MREVKYIKNLLQKENSYIFAVLIISLCLFIIGFIFSDLHQKKQIERDKLIIAEIVRHAEEASKQIATFFHDIKAATAQIEKEVTQSNLTNAEIRAMITESLKSTKGAFRAGLAFKKDRFNETYPLYSPYYQKSGKNTPNQQISDLYDYTQADPLTLIKEGGEIKEASQSTTPRTFWFHQPLKEGAMWLAPYFGHSANTLLSEFIRPFFSDYDKDYSNGFDGVIFMNLSLSDLSIITSELELENSGYAFILSDKNILVAYPKSDFLGKSLAQIAPQSQLIKVVLEQGENISLSRFIHPTNHKESWLMFSPIASSNYRLGILVWAEEVRAKHNIAPLFPYQEVSLICHIGSGIFLLGALIFSRYKTGIPFQICFILCGILFSVLLIISFDKLEKDPKEIVSNQIYDKENINNLLFKQNQKDLFYQDKIQLSLALESINFSAPSTLALIGKVELFGIEKSLDEPPLFFPLSLETNWEKVSKTSNVWRFNAKIRQPFDYASFPFDKEKIQLSIRLKNEYQSSLFIPHFDSYPQMTPRSLIAINQDNVHLNGWEFSESFFSYFDNDFSTLNYNLIIKRKLAGPFITYLFPLLMVLSLAYFTLLMWTKEPKKLALLGFNLTSVLGRISSLFFILILSHISLREALEAKGIIFLEYYYLASYSLLILVSVSTLLYLSNHKNSLINYKDGFFLKLLYWPYFIIFCILASLYKL
ncbi:hypothetical protein MED121_20666 [Marinomonas sp. MED121]|uniref:PDC sensor domain-containing protein n=1 Tax=Marinomonas sp. MED121 TaxID=314277 RepID=UPI00006909E9|nr:hypothetical protein [Marinomonas sp. MED121]EAQ64021.1 hypothetical protein MED121_20666 [Marinomonas sp. MED121]